MSDRIGEVRLVFEGLDLTDPRSAFALGLAYGRALERERVDAEDLAIGAAAARDVQQVIAWADARGD
jgi:hypothetical protein